MAEKQYANWQNRNSFSGLFTCQSASEKLEDDLEYVWSCLQFFIPSIQIEMPFGPKNMFLMADTLGTAENNIRIMYIC